MEAVRGYCDCDSDCGELTKRICFHPGAEHEEPDILKDELQLYEGKLSSSGFGENGTTQRT